MPRDAACALVPFLPSVIGLVPWGERYESQPNSIQRAQRSPPIRSLPPPDPWQSLRQVDQRPIRYATTGDTWSRASPDRPFEGKVRQSRQALLTSSALMEESWRSLWRATPSNPQLGGDGGGWSGHSGRPHVVRQYPSPMAQTIKSAPCGSTSAYRPQCFNFNLLC